MGYRTQILGEPFGDGSDGEAVIDSTFNPAKAEYNYRSLTIESAGEIRQQPWGAQKFPVLILRSQSPIILDGKVTANGVTQWG